MFLQLCSSEQQQQQVFLLDQQLVLLRETNRALSQQLDEAAAHSWTVSPPSSLLIGRREPSVKLLPSQEEAMLRRSAGNDFQRLKDCDVLQKQKLEAASHRIAELESQLARKDKLILELKKLLEETKSHSRSESGAGSPAGPHSVSVQSLLLGCGVSLLAAVELRFESSRTF